MINPKDAMPWVGFYVTGATLACILAMTADAFQGFRQWKLWFPNRFFVLNTIYITLIAIEMKLPVDLCTTGYLGLDGKVVSIAFLFPMLANFLSFLGLMDDKELLVYIVAWAILMITITVNVLIQIFAWIIPPIFFLLLLFPILWVFSIAFTVLASRQILEHMYRELHGLASYPQEIKFSYEELEHNVKNLLVGPYGVVGGGYPTKYSDYNWSLDVILGIQLIGAIIVEEHWTQMLQFWKGTHLLIRFETEENVYNSNVRSEMKEYAKHSSFNFSFVCPEYANPPIVAMIKKKADVELC
ncbi:hypothetical protein Tco_0900964 [Tanacetum coccineum]